MSTRKLAIGAVTRRRLSRGLRNRLDRGAGPAGPPGATGPAGPAGPGAARIAFAAAATAAPAPVTLLDVPGLKLEGACTLSADTVSLPLAITATETSQAQETITIDTGTDPSNPQNSATNNLQFDLPAGIPFEPGPPVRRPAAATTSG